MSHTGIVTATSLHVRTGPGSTYPDAGKGLVKGDDVIASEIVEGWWHLTHINGAIVTVTSWASGAFIAEDSTTVPPPPSDETEVLTAISEINAKLTDIIGWLAGIKIDTDAILNKLNAAPTDPGTPPPPVNDLLDYTGPYVGEYEVIDNGEANKVILVPDSYDRGTSQMNHETAQWYQDNHPEDWNYFVSKGKIWKDPNGLWYFEPQLRRGQRVKIAEINKLKNTGRVIGFSVGENATNQGTDICVHSPADVPWLKWKVPGQPVSWWNIQPWRQKNDKVPNAIWFDMAKLKKVS